MYYIDVASLLVLASIPLIWLYSRKIRRDLEEFPSSFNELKRLEKEEDDLPAFP